MDIVPLSQVILKCAPGVAEGDEGRVESAGERLEGLLGRAAEVDDGEGRNEVRRVRPLVRVERRVVHDLLLRQRVRLKPAKVDRVNKERRATAAKCKLQQWIDWKM